MTTSVAPPRAWDQRRKAKADRLAAVSTCRQGKVIDGARLRDVEVLVGPGDRVALKGDNQQQTDFLSRTLAECDRNRSLTSSRRPLMGAPRRDHCSHCPLQKPAAERMAA